MMTTAMHVEYPNARIRNSRLDGPPRREQRPNRARGCAHRPAEASRANPNGDADMNAKLPLSIVAAALFSLPVYAHDCSGGPDGGMDATGNQCNAVASAPAASWDAPTLASARLPNANGSKAVPCTRCVVARRTSAPRHTSGRQVVKHS
jgi:hypothetical protein